MQVWLEPIQSTPDTAQPLPGVLVRVQYACNKAGYTSHDLDTTVFQACRVAPGNLQDYAGELDSNAWASEVRTTEYMRLTLPKSITSELAKIELHFGQGNIEWCLPIIDPELMIPQVVELCRQLSKQNWLTIYLVCDVDLKRFLPHSRNVQFVTEAQFQAMNVSLGFPKSVVPYIPPPPPPLPAAPMPYFPLDDEEEKPEDTPVQRKKKVKPQFRSITEDYDPSW